MIEQRHSFCKAFVKDIKTSIDNYVDPVFAFVVTTKRFLLHSNSDDILISYGRPHCAFMVTRRKIRF